MCEDPRTLTGRKKPLPEEMEKDIPVNDHKKFCLGTESLFISPSGSASPVGVV
jgi:hypothetical protein